MGDSHDLEGRGVGERRGGKEREENGKGGTGEEGREEEEERGGSHEVTNPIVNRYT